MMYSDDPAAGAGAGKGGGAIREVRGIFRKMEAARDGEKSYKKQKEQVASVKGQLDKEITYHRGQIKLHEDAVRRLQQQMATLPDK